jgi:hypothetical protein
LTAGAGLLAPWKWGASSSFAAQLGNPKATTPGVQKPTGQSSKKFIVVDAQFHHVPTAIYKKVDEATFTTQDGKDLQAKNRDPKNKGKRATRLLQDLESTLRHMDACGTNVAMIQNPSWAVAGMEVCRVLNDGLAKAAEESPKKVLAIGQRSDHLRSGVDRRACARQE